MFCSVITGNLVLFGIGIGKTQETSVLRAGVAIAAYGVGSAVGAFVAGRPKEGQPLWPRRVTVALAVELCLLLGFTLGWELTDALPGSTGKLVLVAVAAVAMGLQSVTVIRLDAHGMSSTYLTSTYVRAITALVRGPRREAVPRLAAVAAIVLGAIGGVLLFLDVPRAAPVVAVVDVAAVLAIGAALGRSGRVLAQPAT